VAIDTGLVAAQSKRSIVRDGKSDSKANQALRYDCPISRADD